MNKFTPGPWEVNTEAGLPLREVFSHSETDVLICDTGCSNVEMDAAEIEANAHLIAAAPEMYEALKDCLRLLEDCTEETYGTPTQEFFQRKADAVKAVLAKSEGKQ